MAIDVRELRRIIDLRRHDLPSARAVLITTDTADALVEAVETLETVGAQEGYCPICGGADGGHAGSCRLGAVLARFDFS